MVAIFTLGRRRAKRSLSAVVRHHWPLGENNTRMSLGESSHR
jgi:hypothetical protein